MNKSVVKVTTSILLTAVISTALAQPVAAYATSGYYDEEENQYTDWGNTGNSEKSANNSSSGSGTAASSTNFSFTPSAKYPFSSIKSNIAEHQKVNSDIKGWLIIPGTNVNEPIAISGKNNNYYMNRDWKGNNYPGNTWTNFKHTVIYADSRTKLTNSWNSSSKNTVLYGHNWTNLRDPMDIGANNNHIMFGQLPSYTSMSFAKENPYIYYSAGENEGIWKVFAVAYCEFKDSFPYNAPNPSKEGYSTLLKEWKSRSMFDFDVDVNTDDRILTLSTCTRAYSNMGENQRFVVVARLLREGESETDKVSVSVNQNMKKPQF